MSKIDGKDAKTRKEHPLFSGVLKYFPDALLEVAELSRIGNEQHNPGQPLHWSRGKSNDHGDCLVRHQIDVGRRDTDGVRHAAKVAWRALAQLQLEIEADEAQAALNVVIEKRLPASPIDRRVTGDLEKQKRYHSRGLRGGRRTGDKDRAHAIFWS